MAERQSKAEKTLDRILDAALDCYEESGISQTRLEEVARIAGIGRTTLYRYVDNRDDLLNKVLLRDAREQQAEMALLTRYHDSLGDILVDTVVHVIRGRRNRPINRLLFGGSESDLIDRINLSPGNFLPLVRETLAPPFEQAQSMGEIREAVTLDMACDWVTRVILSLVTYPGEFLDDEDALRQYLRAFLVPSIITNT